MILLDDYHKLKEQVQRLTAKKDQAEGALQQQMARLREEFGCKTLAEAQAKLLELQNDEIALLRKYNVVYKKFRRKWRKHLKEK
jgi:hypothetical protein